MRRENNSDKCTEFVVGLKKLMDDCELDFVDYNELGPVMFHFKDGSAIGIRKAFSDVGCIKIEDCQYLANCKRIVDEEELDLIADEIMNKMSSRCNFEDASNADNRAIIKEGFKCGYSNIMMMTVSSTMPK